MQKYYYRVHSTNFNIFMSQSVIIGSILNLLRVLLIKFSILSVVCVSGNELNESSVDFPHL